MAELCRATFWRKTDREFLTISLRVPTGSMGFGVRQRKACFSFALQGNWSHFVFFEAVDGATAAWSVYSADVLQQARGLVGTYPTEEAATMWLSHCA